MILEVVIVLSMDQLLNEWLAELPAILDSFSTKWPAKNENNQMVAVMAPIIDAIFSFMHMSHKTAKSMANSPATAVRCAAIYSRLPACERKEKFSYHPCINGFLTRLRIKLQQNQPPAG